MRFLGGAVVLLSIMAVNVTVVAQPTQDLRKAGFAWAPESIGISHKSPDTEGLSVRLFDCGDFGVINEIGDRNLHNEILSGSEHCATEPLRRYGEIKVVREWNRHYFGRGLESKITSRCAARVYDKGSCLKSKISFSFLIDGDAYHNSDIGAQFANGSSFGVPNKAAGFSGVVLRCLSTLPQDFDLLGYLFELGSPMKIGRLGFGLGVPELTLASNPKLVGGQPQPDGRNSEHDSKKGGDSTVMVVKNFSNLDDKEWKHAISGAIFLFGLFGYFAYWIVTRDKGNN
jgi:hypothetical protein